MIRLALSEKAILCGMYKYIAEYHTAPHEIELFSDSLLGILIPGFMLTICVVTKFK